MTDEITVKVLDHGPYLIDASVPVLDAEGNVMEVKGSSIALCRCGHSESKPFCDGSHRRFEFESAPRASQTD